MVKHTISHVLRRVTVIFQEDLSSRQPSHVEYNFERLTLEKVKTKWQLHKKIACARERLMPCHFRLRFACAQSMQSVNLCICMY